MDLSGGERLGDIAEIERSYMSTDARPADWEEIETTGGRRAAIQSKFICGQMSRSSDRIGYDDNDSSRRAVAPSS